MLSLEELLTELDLQQYAPLFAANDIDAEILADLSNADLVEIGIRSLGHRKRILTCATRLREQRGPRPPATALPDVTSEPDLRSTAERREVTTLFADLTGYTELLNRLDTEDIHALLGEFYDRFDVIVKRVGGTVDRHIGDCVMAVFGAPVSRGNDAERALRAALEMHRAMEEMSLRFGRDLSVHIGVAAGNVLYSSQGQGSLRERAFTLTGDSVNLASRLADRAAPGQTLITTTIHNMLGDMIDCAPVAPLDVKGFAGPVSAFRLVGFRSRPVERPLVGRDAEISILSGALVDCARRGQGETIAILGEAGIGKSRVLEELVRLAENRGIPVHKALVLDFGLGDGQDPLREILTGLFGLSRNAEASALRAAVEKLARQGVLDEEGQLFLQVFLGLPLDQPHQRIHDAMSDAARREGRQTMLRAVLRGQIGTHPHLLLVEDLHWASRETLGTLSLLVGLTAEAPILLAVSSRPEGNPLDAAWKAGLGDAALRQLHLSPLGAEDAMRLAEATDLCSEEVIADCVARAEGNPLFLEQLMRHAREHGHERVPGPIQSIIQARLDRLAPLERRFLAAAAILGQRFTMVEATHVAAIDIFDERPLLNASLIRPIQEGYLFSHALIRDAVLRTMLRDDLRALHLRAARLFAGRDGRLHAEHLAAAGDPGAAGAFLAAARDAAAAHRKEAALALTERGLASGAGIEARGALFRLQGEMLRDLGQGDGAIAAFRGALSIAETAKDRCRARIGLAGVMRILDRIPEAEAALDEAQPDAEAGALADDLSEIHYLRGSLHFPRGDLDGCLREHGESLEWARRTGSPERRALALSGLGDAHYARGRMLTAHGVIEECLELATVHGLGAVEAANRFMLATVKIYMLETERALAEALASADLARRVGHARAEIVSRLTAGWILVSMAETGRAQAEVDRGLAIAARLGARRFEPFLEEIAARIALAEGRRTEASHIAEGALHKLRALGAMSFIGPWLLSTTACAAPTAERRREALAEGEAILAAGSVGHNYFRFYRYAIDACAVSGEWAEVRRYADALAAYTAPEPTAWSDFFVARARALADAGAGQGDRHALLRLRAKAEAVRLHAALPAIDAALDRLPAGGRIVSA